MPVLSPTSFPLTYAADFDLFIGTCSSGFMTAGSHTVDVSFWPTLPGQIAPARFTAADVGNPIAIAGVGAVDPLTPLTNGIPGATLHSTITVYNSPTSVDIADAAITTFSGIGNVCVYRKALFYLDSLTYEQSIAPGTRDAVNFTILSTEDYFILNQVIVAGQPVYLRIDGTDQGDFGGLIDDCVSSNQLQPGGGGLTPPTNAAGTKPFSFTIRCASWDSIASRRVVQPLAATSIQSTAGDVAFKLICLTFLDAESVAIDAVSAPNINIDCPAGSYVSDLLNQVCSLCNGADPLHTYFWFVDAWKTFHFVIETTITAPWNIDNDDTILTAVNVDVSHNGTGQQYANQCFRVADLILGGGLLVTFAGDGTSKQFNTAANIYAPPAVTLNTVVQTVGVWNVDTGMQWYWQQGTSAIIQDPGDAAIGSADLLQVSYQSAAPGVAVAFNNTGLTEREAVEGIGAVYQSTKTISSPITRDDLLALAEADANSQGTIPTKITATTLKAGLRAGQMQNVILDSDSVDGDFLITQIKMSSQDNVIYWDVTWMSGNNTGNSSTGLVSFINRGQNALSIITPTPPITTPNSALVQTGAGNPSSFGASVTAGNLLLVVVATGANATMGNPPTISDTLGNVWNQAVFNSNGGGFPNPNLISIMWAIANGSGSTTITATGPSEMVFAEFSGVNAVGTVDAVGAGNTLITTQDFDLVICGLEGSETLQTCSAPEQILGFTFVFSRGWGLNVAWAVVPSTGGFTSTLTNVGPGLAPVYAIAAFRSSNVPIPPPTPTPTPGNPRGTVTNLTGALTLNEPVFGNGGADVKIGTKTGNTEQVQCASGSAGAAGDPLVYDASGNAVAGSFPASGLSLEVNGTPNASQTLLNLIEGTNVTITDGGSGNVTISASGSGGSGFYPTLTVPTSGSFSWVNQLSTTVTDLSNRETFSMPTNATDPNWRLWINSGSLSSHWRVTVAMNFAWAGLPSYTDFGVFIRDSGSGKFYFLGIDSANGLRAIQFNSVTSVNSVSTIGSIFSAPLHFMRISWDGTNRTFEYSSDGWDYTTVVSQANNTTFITPDQVGAGFANFVGSTRVVGMFHFLLEALP